MTSYGEALSVKESGRQEYHFKNVPGTEAFRKVDYVLTPVKPNAKLSSGNFLAPSSHVTAGSVPEPCSLRGV